MLFFHIKMEGDFPEDAEMLSTFTFRRPVLTMRNEDQFFAWIILVYPLINWLIGTDSAILSIFFRMMKMVLLWVFIWMENPWLLISLFFKDSDNSGSSHSHQLPSNLTKSTLTPGNLSRIILT